MTVNDTTKSGQGKVLVILAVLVSIGLAALMLMNPGTGVKPPVGNTPPATTATQEQKDKSSEVASPTAPGTPVSSDTVATPAATPALPPLPTVNEPASSEAAAPEASESTPSN